MTVDDRATGVSRPRRRAGDHARGRGPTEPLPRRPGARHSGRGLRGRHARLRKAMPLWVEVLVLVVVAAVLAVGVQTFVVRQFWIPSGSMENTLQIDDRVLVNRLIYRFRPVERGDIVVFDGSGLFTPEVTAAPADNPIASLWRGAQELLGVATTERDFIKRVIGVGGDRVVCCDAAGRITVNGIALDESAYLYPGNTPSDEPFDVIVPEGALWVMGDHRGASSDSRAFMGRPGGGFVPVDRVIGRAMAVVWPIGQTEWLDIPATFEQPGLD